jgi:hypothetical protein
MLGPAIVSLLLATLEITRTVAAASLSILIVMTTLLAIATARIARACNDDQRYALVKVFLGIYLIAVVIFLTGQVFLGNGFMRFILFLFPFVTVISIPALMLLLKFKGLLLERGLVDRRKVRPTQLVSAVAIIAFAAVGVLFGSRLHISILDAVNLVTLFVGAPLAVVTLHEGLVLLYGLLLESLADRP